MAAEAGLCPTWLQIPKIGFLVMKLKCEQLSFFPKCDDDHNAEQNRTESIVIKVAWHLKTV